MKKNILLMAAGLLLLGSCDFLEFDETDALKTEENVYDYFSSAEQVLTSIYTYLPRDLSSVGGSMRDCASDDGEYGASSGTIQYFNNGTWSATNVVDDAWDYYEGIRIANSFLEHLETIDFSRFEHTTNYAKEQAQLATWGYQARLLRATFFFELARRYGDIAMPLGVLTPEEDKTITKTAFDDVIDFIASECDDCAANLPSTYAVSQFDNEVGRVTSGYAMALKTKALLYAASPLHNSSGDRERYSRAASAAYDLMELGTYSLSASETANNTGSSEAILMNRRGNDWTFELRNFPIRFTEGRRSTPATASFPSQNLVDAFETINGYSVTLTADGFVSDDPEFDPSRPFDNRDPRLARAVLADGMSFKGSVIDVSEGGADYAAVTEGGSPTGYFLKKYVQESTNFTVGSESQQRHAWVVSRYAEIVLSYAEAVAYALGDPNATSAEFPISAIDALNQVRANAGMPAKSAASLEAFIPIMRNEWRVEFAFEDHRFWDVRRWNIGSSTQTKLYGVEVTENSGVKSYSLNLVENRSWRACMNLYPIPQEKVYVNENLHQNEGW